MNYWAECVFDQHSSLTIFLDKCVRVAWLLHVFSVNKCFILTELQHCLHPVKRVEYVPLWSFSIAYYTLLPLSYIARYENSKKKAALPHCLDTLVKHTRRNKAVHCFDFILVSVSGRYKTQIQHRLAHIQHWIGYIFNIEKEYNLTLHCCCFEEQPINSTGRSLICVSSLVLWSIPRQCAIWLCTAFLNSLFLFYITFAIIVSGGIITNGKSHSMPCGLCDILFKLG